MKKYAIVFRDKRGEIDSYFDRFGYNHSRGYRYVRTPSISFLTDHNPRVFTLSVAKKKLEELQKKGYNDTEIVPEEIIDGIKQKVINQRLLEQIELELDLNHQFRDTYPYPAKTNKLIDWLNGNDTIKTLFSQIKTETETEMQKILDRIKEYTEITINFHADLRYQSNRSILN